MRLDGLDKSPVINASDGTNHKKTNQTGPGKALPVTQSDQSTEIGKESGDARFAKIVDIVKKAQERAEQKKKKIKSSKKHGIKNYHWTLSAGEEKSGSGLDKRV